MLSCKTLASKTNLLFPLKYENSNSNECYFSSNENVQIYFFFDLSNDCFIYDLK